MIAIYIIATAVPTLLFALAMQRYGWVMPIDVKAADKPVPEAGLVTAFWAASLAFAFFNGLMYGTRTALFMDLCTASVAATQFTAYMALLNLTIAYNAWWQGVVAKNHGYPATLLIDAGVGMVCLLLLPLLGKRKERESGGAG